MPSILLEISICLSCDTIPLEFPSQTGLSKMLLPVLDTSGPKQLVIDARI